MAERAEVVDFDQGAPPSEIGDLDVRSVPVDGATPAASRKEVRLTSRADLAARTAAEESEASETEPPTKGKGVGKARRKGKGKSKEKETVPWYLGRKKGARGRGTQVGKGYWQAKRRGGRS